MNPLILARVNRFIGAIALLMAFAAPAAQAQTGRIIGTIADGETGDPLIGAFVVLVDTEYGGVCDIEGVYRLMEAPPGTYTLEASMIGYNKATVTGVVVVEGETTDLDITLKTEAISVDEVVVEARALRNTDASLLKERQKAPAVSDAISAEDISRAGSGDAAEAMTHVTGASVQDGKYVLIRGLGDRYSKVQLNGSDVPSADPNKRTVPMDLFPSNLLDNIVTVKTFTPDKPGNFTGGSVNIGTKSFPEDLTFSVSTSTSLNTQTTFEDVLDYEGGSDDWLGIDDGTRAIPAAVAKSDIPPLSEARNDPDKARALDALSKAFSPTMAPTTSSAPLNQSYSVAFGNQVDLGGRPFGFLGSFSYSNKQNFYDGGASSRWNNPSGTAEVLTNDFVLEDAKASQEVMWGGLINGAYRFAPTHEVAGTFMFNHNSDNSTRYLSGSFPRDLQVSDIYETRVLQFTERRIQSFQLKGKHLWQELGGLRADWSGSVASSTQEEPDLRFFTNTLRVVTRGGQERIFPSIQASIYPVPTRYFRDLEEKNQDFRVDFTLPFKQWIGLQSNVKAGFAALNKDRTFGESRYEFRQDDIDYDDEAETFFAEENVGLIETDARGRNLFGNYLVDASQLSSNYKGEQQVYAGYAMVELPLTTGLRLITGGRLESTKMDVESADPTKEKGKLDNNDLLPSLNLVYELGEGMNLRGAYGRTLARPTFRELAPFASFSFVGDFIFIGNPELKRTLVDNYDVRWELFPNPGEIYAVSLFYKNFENPIERAILTVNGEVQFQNVEQATVSGLELEARKNLAFLGESMGNFFAGGNVSFIRSKVTIPATELQQRRATLPDVDDERSLQGQSPFILNLDLAYDNFRSGTAGGLYYNLFGRRLDEVSLGGTPDVFEEARGTLDFTFAQRLGSYKAKISAKNLLDPDVRKTHKFKGQKFDTSRYKKGRSFSLSLTYALKN